MRSSTVPTTQTADVLVVATMRRWVAEEFQAAADRRGLPLVHSLGFDVPDLSGYARPAWWAPTEHAARLRHVGVPLPLLAPGPRWLAEVPMDLTGRVVWAGPLSEIAHAPPRGWAKPAEVKVEQLPAAWWDDTDAFAAAAYNAGLSNATWVQVCATHLEIDVEHRCFVHNGQVVATSPYLLADGTSYFEGMEQRRHLGAGDAVAYAQDVVDALGDAQPPAYVLDVARTESGWVVLEGNPAWSSAVYGADIDAALDTVLAAADHAAAHTRWHWRPDPWLVRRAARKVPLPRR